MNATTIIAALHGGVLGADLDLLSQSIRDRRETLSQRTMGQLHPGSRVKMNDRTKPTYLIGATGTVRRVMYKYLMIDFDEPQVGPMGKSWHKNVRCPISLLEVFKEEEIRDLDLTQQ